LHCLFPISPVPFFIRPEQQFLRLIFSRFPFSPTQHNGARFPLNTNRSSCLPGTPGCLPINFLLPPSRLTFSVVFSIHSRLFGLMSSDPTSITVFSPLAPPFKPLPNGRPCPFFSENQTFFYQFFIAPHDQYVGPPWLFLALNPVFFPYPRSTTPFFRQPACQVIPCGSSVLSFPLYPSTNGPFLTDSDATFNQTHKVVQFAYFLEHMPYD